MDQSWPWRVALYTGEKRFRKVAHEHSLETETKTFILRPLTRSGVFEDKVFIIKLPAVNGLSAGTVVVGKVASLAHKLRDNTVEAAALVAKALFMCAQAAKVLYKKKYNKRNINIHF